MNYVEIRSNKNFIKLSGYLIRVDAIDVIRPYDRNYEYKDAVYGIEIVLRGKDHSIDIRYKLMEERDNDFNKLCDIISII